jgi:hypothetical protein
LREGSQKAKYKVQKWQTEKYATERLSAGSEDKS